MPLTIQVKEHESFFVGDVRITVTRVSGKYTKITVDDNGANIEVLREKLYLKKKVTCDQTNQK